MDSSTIIYVPPEIKKSIYDIKKSGKTARDGSLVLSYTLSLFKEKISIHTLENCLNDIVGREYNCKMLNHETDTVTLLYKRN